ncbi:alanine--tRNA ligase [Candidatus Xianfuyuplasma coldseepsis]|uniref:Alanine--tRNA ligase n=1 Tax=Candidatus Xianfuyuplasma coldseepsis TaxID=2782163 RepID=A0A7L7KTI3_9MOLU|nr:alanine--tRNA ligase [Xianfuyuplasma coldseepsis]QMS85612.1 alanine--tRNA ligase [Xianfuyuplasma coldseepsis]
MKQQTTNEIRQMWLDFFKDKHHKVEESASLIPNNDPTLLWINAGVAPLKKYFDGRVIPSNPRIVNAQKCIRTNDIDNVGKTARHQTFFEMLGNFSIGDYFRDEIIPWAYELLFDDAWYGFAQENIYITVYPDDQDTYDAWVKAGIAEDHLIRCEHNFWEIGEGPCGPDTEIFYDRGEAYGPFDLSLVEHDIENDRFIEIWNIVFSQFNAKNGLSRDEYPELPSKNIDTGMGLERMACVIQDVPTNFETDTFMTIIHGIERYANQPYNGQMSYKVIADHVRTVTFAVSDGAVLSNEGRGYVLRRLLRRAIKHGKSLGINHPFLFELVDDVIAAMGDFYTYLTDQKQLVQKVIRLEEEKFFETLSQGEKILDEIITTNASKTLSGEQAFTLYDTYGFPLELTMEMAEEAGFSVDVDGFHHEMNKQKERARSARKNLVSMNHQNEAFINFKEQDEFTGYHHLREETTVLKAFEEGVVLAQTPFYAESGGQVADQGVLRTDDQEYVVQDVQKLPNGQFIHLLDHHDLRDGDPITAIVDEETRRLTMYNHSATHLLFAALREVVGSHVSQQGSNVSSEAMRFDFNNYDNLDDDTLLEIERIVNQHIQEAKDVDISEQTIEDAKNMGAIAEFGEKYSDKVRVVNMGTTIDLCGGTHVENTGDIEKFAIASIESKGSGIYRISGHANASIDNIRQQFVGFHKEMDKLEEKAHKIVEEAHGKGIELSFEFKRNSTIIGSYQDVINKRNEFAELGQIVRDLDKKYQELSKQQTMENTDQYLAQKVGNTLVIKTQDIDKNSLRPLADSLMDHLTGGFVFIANITGDKVTFIAKSQNKKLHAGQIAKQAAVICGGNGGGRPDMAQAGGKDITKVDDALHAVKELIQ